MAARKSTDNIERDTASPEVDESQLKSGKEPVESGVNVERLAKGVLPPNTSIQRDALLAITKAATVFVSYLSSHANEETEKKTITPQDVLSALKEIEFDSFCPRLERELAVYTEAAIRKRRSQTEKKSRGKPPDQDKPRANEGEEGPIPKRIKRDDEKHILEKEMGEVPATIEDDTEGSRGKDSHTEEVGQRTETEGHESMDDEDDEDAEDAEDDEYDEDDGEDDDGNESTDVEGSQDEGTGNGGFATGAEELSEETDSTGAAKYPDLDSDLASGSD
ncbi:predicted protein [Uncinocarpus reesii 1704]|uniref:DNA polymerase epsilon subunit D n=1 Tax=Uncinocarpus reesii (strain UAMH 1704) TaxID=336963 RepID=C4JQS4_UNCRE|nr:uncharacterized protein UREG_03406 [Uncinocarpus reesii 1704]EEP78560.1 predicted protein [Uncinocarpus reesii 1704]